MPPSKGYYLKPCNRTSIPRCVIGVHCVTRPAKDGIWTERRRDSELSCVVTSHSIYNWTGWTPIQTIVHGSHHAFWEWLEDESWDRKRLSLFASNATEALTLLRFWDRLDSEGVTRKNRSGAGVRNAVECGVSHLYELHSNITTNRVSITDYSRLGIRYVWTSLTQYLPLSMGEIAEMVGARLLDDEPVQEGGEVEVRPFQAESCVIVRAVQHVSNWWKAHKGGPWANSIGSLASRFLRSRLQPRTLCTHTHAEALALERKACFGGRVSCWYVGDVASRTVVNGTYLHRPPRANHTPVDGPVYSVDVQSMYPHLLASKIFPVKLIGLERCMRIDDLSVLLRYVCVVASVTLDTNQSEYPYRDRDSVYYPTGRFNTVLCGPELRYALDHNHIAAIHTAAIYQSGTPFAGSAIELLAARENAVGGRRSPGARFVKLLSNSIGGTLAQRRTEWIPCQGMSLPIGELGEEVRWGPFLRSVPDRSWNPSDSLRYVVCGGDVERYRPRLITRYRAIAGLVERLERSEVGTGTLQACYAYLTSYGRSMMRDLRSTMPERSVLIQDTDGMWVTESGYDALVTRAETFGTLPGRLTVDKRIQLARIYGAKHYWYDGQWVLSGFHDAAYDCSSGTVTDIRTSNPFLGTPSEPPSVVTEYTRESELLLLHQHGHQQSDGWIVPYHLSEGVRK